MTERDPPASSGQLPKYLAKGLPKQDSETLAETCEYIEELLAWGERPVEKDDLPEAAEPVDESGQGQGTVVEEMVTCGVSRVSA